jgi:hypothetical protein
MVTILLLEYIHFQYVMSWIFLRCSHSIAIGKLKTMKHLICDNCTLNLFYVKYTHNVFLIYLY